MMSAISFPLYRICMGLKPVKAATFLHPSVTAIRRFQCISKKLFSLFHGSRLTDFQIINVKGMKDWIIPLQRLKNLRSVNALI